VKINTIVHKPWVLVLLLVLSSLSSIAQANEEGEQLRRTMAEIALLNSQMAQRKADADGIRESLSIRLAEIENEALQLLREKNITNQADALENPRVYYNLLLMAEIESYIGRYAQRIGYYRVACDRLSYLYQQADDDLKIVNTLSELKIDALVAQTGKILDEYLPDAQTIVVNPATLTADPPDKMLARLKWVK
jgi:hypothetical protein